MYPCSRPLGGNRIRLIRITPGDWEDPISCELHYTALDAIHSYHTLSYVWGPPKITRPILLNGQKYEVTVNLESALRHLRHQLREETLVWIDALCINQSDGDERTHQVGLMGSIYRNCKSVLVYIGDGVDRFKQKRKSRHGDRVPPPILKFGQDEGHSPIKPSVCTSKGPLVHPMPKEVDKLDKVTSDTSRVFAMVETLSKAKHLQELSWAQPTDDPTTQEELRTLFELLRQFSHAPFTPWWTRIWVVQETVLPPVVTIICGSVSAPWTMFAQAASRYLDHFRGCCHQVSTIVPRDHLNVLQSFSRLIFDLDELRRTFSDMNTHEKYQMVSQDQLTLVNSKEGSPDTALLSLLRRFRNRKATDPRDKVYALLSLCPSTSVLPDYAASEREVYVRAALESIYATQSLSVLHVDISRKYRHDLPSWVPDWEAQGEYNDNHRLETLNLYQVHGESVISQLTVSSDMNCLYIDSKFVDTIEEVHLIMLSEDPESMRSTLYEWFVTADILGVYSSFIRIEEIWRIICADVITIPSSSTDQRSVRRARPQDELMFATWMLLSPRSPFAPSQHRYTPPAFYQEFFSIERWAWWSMYILELWIQNRDFVSAMSLFEVIFPSVDTRAALIREAVGEAFLAGTDAAIHQFAGFEDLELDDVIRKAISDTDDPTRSENETNVDTIGPNQEGVPDEFAQPPLHRDFTEVWGQFPWLKVLDSAWRHLIIHSRPTVPPAYTEVVTENIATMESSILSATKHRRLFTTEKGHIGLGPASMNTGDSLCFLKGGRSPFILRNTGHNIPREETISRYIPEESVIKQQGSQQVDMQCYQIIGDCYAHGLMGSEETSGQTDKAHISATSTESVWYTIAID